MEQREAELFAHKMSSCYSNRTQIVLARICAARVPRQRRCGALEVERYQRAARSRSRRVFYFTKMLTC